MVWLPAVSAGTPAAPTVHVAVSMAPAMRGPPGCGSENATLHRVVPSTSTVVWNPLKSVCASPAAEICTVSACDAPATSTRGGTIVSVTGPGLTTVYIDAAEPTVAALPL